MNGDRNGYGVYKWPSGANYTGEFRNGDQHGHGVYTWPNGDKYDG